jgi:hypothetical protein
MGFNSAFKGLKVKMLSVPDIQCQTLLTERLELLQTLFGVYQHV